MKLIKKWTISLQFIMILWYKFISHAALPNVVNIFAALFNNLPSKLVHLAH